jgi:N-acetylglutamate synthase-like GNAT family acetyltransferase
LNIRVAGAADQRGIYRIVRAAGINPFGLHWPRFLIAEDGGRIVGVAQIKPHSDGSRELASLAVIPDRRGEGIGSALIRTCLAREQGPVYLMCQPELESYYSRFGFRKLHRTDMPPYFRRMMRVINPFFSLAALLSRYRLPIVMRRPPQPPASR